MIDDHDRYEWVNVSSGTGSPGKSRTKIPYNGCSVVVVVVYHVERKLRAAHV